MLDVILLTFSGHGASVHHR